jgi:hypothetical protein
MAQSQYVRKLPFPGLLLQRFLSLALSVKFKARMGKLVCINIFQIGAKFTSNVDSRNFNCFQPLLRKRKLMGECLYICSLLFQMRRKSNVAIYIELKVIH